MYIVDNVTGIIWKLNTSAIAGVGDLISRDKEKSYHLFKEYNALSFFLATIVCIPLFFVLNSFIQIWHDGRIATSIAVAAAFILNAFYMIIRMPTNTYVNSAGLFKETRICPIIESVVNLTFSLILVNVLGLPGVLIATFISYIISDYLIKPRIVYKKLFTKSVKEYYGINTFYIAIMVGLVLLWYFILPGAPTNSYFHWFLYAGMIFAVNFAVTLGIYIVTKQAYFLERIKSLFQRNKQA